MRPELEAVLRSLEKLTPEEIPGLVGELHTVLAHCQLKLSRPEGDGIHPPDRRIDAKEAAARLGVSVDYLYRHHRQFPFTARAGKKLLFSSNGIDRYIARKR